VKIVYAYELDVADPMVQSGRPAAILRALERAGHEVVRAFPLRRELRYLFVPRLLRARRRGLVYRPDREPLYLKSLALQVERRVRAARPDVLFAPGSHVLAWTDVACPVVMCADATFADVLDAYPDFSRCDPAFIEKGHAQERGALRRCAAAVFPSEPTARSAIEAYGAPAPRVHVVPFGANVEAAPRAVVEARIGARTLRPLRLLFVGRDWERKGADLVLAAGELLVRAGVAVELDLVGIARAPRPLPGWVRAHGLLDKREPAQRAALEALYAGADFFFVPSRAENYGMAFCEAAAHGLPSLTTRVGGIPTIVRDGATGHTLAPDAPAQAYADRLQAALADPAGYRAMARAAYEDFCARLNWDAFGRRLGELLERAVAERRSQGGIA
jgi:glycosyltransferase involved in cell wall biosynthesis